MFQERLKTGSYNCLEYNSSECQNPKGRLLNCNILESKPPIAKFLDLFQMVKILIWNTLNIDFIIYYTINAITGTNSQLLFFINSIMNYVWNITSAINYQQFYFIFYYSRYSDKVGDDKKSLIDHFKRIPYLIILEM